MKPPPYCFESVLTDPESVADFERLLGPAPIMTDFIWDHEIARLNDAVYNAQRQICQWIKSWATDWYWKLCAPWPREIYTVYIEATNLGPLILGRGETMARAYIDAIETVKSLGWESNTHSHLTRGA